jgi:glycosyltransferase involved in cell wall biosynthesis
MFACEAASWPRPDLILTSIPVLELAEQAVNFGNREGIPVAVDVQDLWPDLYLNAFPKCLRSIARPALWTEFRRCRKILRSASSVTAVSESYLGWALKRAGRAQRESDGCFHLSCVRPEALSNAESTECIRQELGIARDAVVVLFVGSFGASYDIATMVQAARILQKSSSNPKIHFLLAGAGEKLPKARLLADGLPNISLTGWVDQTRVEALSSTADLALCAYAREALQSIPYKAAEYLAHGLPIISSLEGDLRRLLEKERCGLFYRAGRPESLAAEITELASSAYLRSEMSARARKLFEEQFDAASVNLAWLSKLEAVARTERRNP